MVRQSGGRRHSIYNSVSACRNVNFENKNLQDFVNGVGRGIAGTGITCSLGSMSLKLMESIEFEGLLAQLTPYVQNHVDTRDLCEELNAVLANRPPKIDLVSDGIGLFGERPARRSYLDARLGFRAVLGSNPELVEDLNSINNVLSNNNLGTLVTASRRTLRLTFANVSTERITRGQGENPHLLIPSGAVIPGEIALEEAYSFNLSPNNLRVWL